MDLLPLLLYLSAASAYALYFASPDRRRGHVATALLASGVLAHTFVIGMRTMEWGHAPFAGTSAAISAFVWLLGLAYLYIENTTDERSMGLFIVVLLSVLQYIPTLNPPVADAPPTVLRSPLFIVHVSSMLFAYASFGLACVIGVTYVLMFKEIKKKQLGFFYSRMPSLQVLDRMNMRAVGIGWTFITAGIMVGGAWAMTQAVQTAPDPRLRAMSIVDPKILVALLCWAVYSFHLVSRRLGWGGRRSAWLSAIGFGIVLLNFVPVGFFLTRSHNF
ncbi:MAG TPA: cytochrome c biogenesis protein CcsA [Vicinamibacterales bacterium]|nr:cytochrome c biogenesis protein CcsA [Vicinamibacterales bacterium]